MKLILGIVCALTLSACMSSNHTMPDGKRLDRYRRAAQAVFQPELDALDADFGLLHGHFGSLKFESINP